MSKSNKKQFDRLKDSCRRNRRRSERHHINQLLKEGKWEQAQDMEESPLGEESGEKGESSV